uniref:uncharacterized protein LOC122581985 n=1 Tax=Erigeron canadensis TaxID=72917 RepID=UPI001CB96D2E|nr:uncharacterized protein LOC122581985 [Erigeron canadensis]
MDKLQQQSESPTDDLFLKWGNKKRLRCARTKDPDDPVSDPPFSVSDRRRIRRRINSRFAAFPSDNQTNNNLTNNNNSKHSTRLTRNSDVRSETSRKLSPEKEVVEKPAVNIGGGCSGSQKVKYVWPKLNIGLTNKEKEEDFMAMKGCKPAHRPKKRPKLIQRSLLLVCPGGWLTDICQDRYEVVEKKSTKKRPAGLKAMGSMESDSE